MLKLQQEPMKTKIIIRNKLLKNARYTSINRGGNKMTLLKQTLDIIIDKSNTMNKKQFKEYYIAIAGMFTEEEGKDKILRKGEEVLKSMR